MVKKSKKKAEEGKVCALLSYLLIGIIWYFLDFKMKKNNFVKFHVKQGLWLIILGIIVGIIVSFLSFIPVIGFLLSLILNILILVFVIIGIINSLNLDKKELPIIGEYANNVFKF